MKEFRVIVTKKADKQLQKLQPNYRRRVILKLGQLALNPYIGKKLDGEFKDLWTVRVWPYRIIYSVVEQELIVEVLKIEHRQGVYGK